MPKGVVSIHGDVLGHEALTPATREKITASLVTTSTGRQAKTALISVETAAVRFRVDDLSTHAVTGLDADTGHVIPAGGSYVIQNHRSIRNAAFIDDTGAAATVRITTFG